MTKQQILNAVKEENKILTHLFGKIKSGEMQFSPGEKMRTTEELLRYISYAAVATINWYNNNLTGVEDKNAFKKYVDKAAGMDINKFPEALEAQYNEIETILGNFTDDELKIVNSSLKYLTAYRMQLFLYLKQAGQPELNTYNCWVGMDAPPKK